MLPAHVEGIETAARRWSGLFQCARSFDVSDRGYNSFLHWDTLLKALIIMITVVETMTDIRAPLRQALHRPTPRSMPPLCQVLHKYTVTDSPCLKELAI